MINLNKKESNHDYYPQAKSDDKIQFLQAKIEEISRKVLRNTEDIKLIKQINKSEENKVHDLSDELIKFKQRNNSLH